MLTTLNKTDKTSHNWLLPWFWESMSARSNRVVLKMGQKINPIAFRLGNRLCWDNIWSTRDHDYATKSVFSTTRKSLLQEKYDFIGVFSNDIYVFNTNKPIRTIAKCFGKNVFSKDLEKNSQKKQNILYDNDKEYSKNVVTLNRSDRSVNDTLFFPLEKLKRQKISASKRVSILPILNAQTVAEYIAKQTVLSQKKKDLAFKRNLSNGITEVTLSILKRFKLFKSDIISGLKIECAGRWNQAARGQKTRFVVGNVPSQSSKHYISYGFSTIHTKYGSCGFKVWICYNNI